MDSKVFVNGKIFTSNSDMPYASGMVIEDGFIKWIGNDEDIKDKYPNVIDLKGSRVLPGLIDAHMHPLSLANVSKGVPCLPPDTNSIEDLITHIKKKRQDQGPDKAIIGRGYDEGKLRENRSPNRYDLDKAAPDVPVILTRTCGHIDVVNSKALELAGINKNTPDPFGGQIDRDEDGQPTGILKETSGGLLRSIRPIQSIEESVNNLCDLSEKLLAHGVTAVTEMGAGKGKIDYYDIYNDARDKGFKQRVVLYYSWSGIKENPDFDKKILNKDNPIFVGGIKLMADGSVSGRTAWVDPPYLGDKEDCGVPTTSREILLQAAEFAKEHNLQITAHAMGEQAIDLIVDTFYDMDHWIKDIPTIRVEHAAMPTDQAMRRAGESGIAFVTQPIFQYCEIESYLKNLGLERTKTTYPIRSILDKGVKLAFSSDSPATSWSDPSNPFVGIKAATTRTSYNGIDCGQDHKIDVPSSIILYTREAQEVCGIPKIGQLAIGYHGDFLVLDRDILDISPDEIDQINVLETYMGGDLVYKK